MSLDQNLAIAVTDKVINCTEEQDSIKNTACDVTVGNNNIDSFKFDNHNTNTFSKEDQNTKDLFAYSRPDEINEERFRVDRKKLESLLQGITFFKF